MFSNLSYSLHPLNYFSLSYSSLNICTQPSYSYQIYLSDLLLNCGVLFNLQYKNKLSIVKETFLLNYVILNLLTNKHLGFLFLTAQLHPQFYFDFSFLFSISCLAAVQHGVLKQLLMPVPTAGRISTQLSDNSQCLST